MWKGLGCGICWKLVCGFRVEDEGFNKSAWQCVWSQLTLELRPLPWCRRNAADANIISRYWSNMRSPYWCHSFCLHQAIAAGVSSHGLEWCWACFSNCLPPLTLEPEFLPHTLCLIWAAFVSCSVNLPKSGHATLTGMWFLFASNLLARDSLDKFLLENFFLEAKNWRQSSWHGDLGEKENIWKTRKCLDLSGRKEALCSRLSSILCHYF